MVAALRSPPKEEQARVRIAGVRTPIVGRVDRRTRGAMTLTRDLAFLRIGTVVRDADGHAGRIDGVWIAMDGDVPALCVEIAYEEDASRTGRPPAVRGDATLGYEHASLVAAGRKSGMRARSRTLRDDTNHDATITFPSEPPPTVPVRTAAIVVRRSLFDRALDTLDDLVTRVRAAVRSIVRRLPVAI